jgi:hypothetical protein
MSQNTITTITEILGQAPASWVNGSFKAVVTKTRDAQGKTPGKATLVDPDNPASQITGSFFGGYPTKWEGMICVFSGGGMRRTEYNNSPQITFNDKTSVDVFQARSGAGTAGGEPGKHMPIAPSQAVISATKVNFADEMGRIGLMYIHAVGQARNASAVIKAQHGIDMTDAMFQSCVASIFIEANKNGLARYIPLDPIKAPPATAPAPKVADPEADAGSPF